jgi:hypothetical protein
MIPGKRANKLILIIPEKPVFKQACRAGILEFFAYLIINQTLEIKHRNLFKANSEPMKRQKIYKSDSTVNL